MNFLSSYSLIHSNSLFSCIPSTLIFIIPLPLNKTLASTYAGIPPGNIMCGFTAARPETAGGAAFGLSNKPRTLLLKKLPKRGMGILSQIKFPRVSEPRNPFRISRRIDSVATFGQFLKLQSPGEESQAKHRPSGCLWPSSIKLRHIAQ